MSTELLPLGSHSLAAVPQRGPLAEIQIKSGWPELDELYSLYPGQLTVVTGVPGHGKSTFLLNLLAKLAGEKNITSFLYVPENEQSIYAKMRKIWQGNQASFDRFAANRFYIQCAEYDEDTEEPHTIDWILTRAEWFVKNRGAEVVMLDPWNELDHLKPRDWTMADYITQAIRRMKRFVRTHKVSLIVVVHPTKDALKLGEPPGLAHCEGSAGWINRTDNGLVVWRKDYSNNVCEVSSVKVREQPEGGMIGKCWFKVDYRTGVFKPMPGMIEIAGAPPSGR